MGVTLRAKANYGTCFIFEIFEISVFVSVYFCGHKIGDRRLKSGRLALIEYNEMKKNSHKEHKERGEFLCVSLHFLFSTVVRPACPYERGR